MPPPRSPASTRSPALPPGTRAIDQALSDSEPLAALSRRLRESQSRLDCVWPLLTPALQACVKAGPIDEVGWTLLATNGAVSSKLRQMVPALDAHLRAHGWPGPPVRIKLLGPA